MAEPFAALVANIAVYVAQGMLMGGVGNAVTRAVDLVPHYWQMLAISAVLALAGCAIAAASMHMVSRAAQAQAATGSLAFSKRVLVRLAAACLLVFAGIFVMRFAFYMMHLTVGLAV